MSFLMRHFIKMVVHFRVCKIFFLRHCEKYMRIKYVKKKKTFKFNLILK